MKCPKCQADNADTLKFCGECGTRLTLQNDPSPSFTKTLETPNEELKRGSVFAGRYEIIEELGKGGMGRVYRVEDKKIKKEIALKLIKSEIASDKKTIERFKNELTTARGIRHKNVCGMFDLGEEKEQHYITMEYVSGGDLKRLIRRTKRLDTGTAISIGKQICEGLEEAHNLGIVHRDLKPQNIMIDTDGNARIMDFGIARSIKEKGITGAGVMIGTPEYMSPEQVEAKDIDQRSDIYSLGIILYEMVTGRLPFEADTPFAIGVKHKSETPKNPKEFNQQIPDDLSGVILKCLGKEKENRYQSVSKIKNELEKVEQGLPTTDRIIPKKKPLTSKEITVKLNVKKALIPAVVVLVLAIVALFLWRFIFPTTSNFNSIAVPAVVVLVLAIVALFLWRFIFPTTSNFNSIAVLPFEDKSPGQDQEHWATGIPETLINSLSRIDGLLVPGTTSSFYFKGERDIRKIGERLGVNNLLEGSIQVSDDTIRIMVRLIDIDSGSTLWSDEYVKNIDDIFSIQNHIAQSVVKELKIKFLGEKQGPIVKTTTENNSALSLYLQGNNYLREANESDFYHAIEFFDKAILEDTGFAQAYIGLAQSYTTLASHAIRPNSELLIKAEAAVEKALELDDSLAEAHSEYGGILAYFRWDWLKAEREFKLALELNPGSARALTVYGRFLFNMRRYEEAYIHAEKAMKIDPLRIDTAQLLGAIMADLGQFEESEEHLLNCLEINPTAMIFYWELALTYIRSEQFEKALDALNKQIELMEGENISDEIAMMAFANARWGKKEEATEYLKQLISYSEQNYVSPTIFSVVYGALGDLNEAFKWLEVAYDQKDFRFSYVLGFWYDPMRSDPRYQEILRKIGLDK